MPVLSKGLKGSKSKKARRKIRRLTRALGMVRELDVALKAVDELGRGADIPRPATDELRAHVLSERQRRRDEMLETLEGINIAKLGRRLDSVVCAIEETAGLEWRQVLGRRLLNRAKRLASAVDEAGQLYAPERLHEVRIAAKKLRYALELAAEAGAKSADPHVRTLKRVQEFLGRLQDLQGVRSRIKAVQAADGKRAPHGGLDTIASRVDDESRRLHGRYVAASQGLSALAADVRRTVVPQVVHTKRARPIKMKIVAARAASARRPSTSRR